MNKLKSYGMAAAGILILVLGFFLFKAAGDPEGFMQALLGQNRPALPRNPKADGN